MIKSTLEEQKAELASLRQALLEGEASGPAAPFSYSFLITPFEEMDAEPILPT